MEIQILVFEEGQMVVQKLANSFEEAEEKLAELKRKFIDENEKDIVESMKLEMENG